MLNTLHKWPHYPLQSYERGILLSLFNRWGNWGLERVNNLLNEVTYIASNRKCQNSIPGEMISSATLIGPLSQFDFPERVHPAIPVLTFSQPMPRGPGCFIRSNSYMFCHFLSISGPQLPQRHLRMSNIGGTSEAIKANPFIVIDGGNWGREQWNENEQESHTRVSVEVKPHDHILPPLCLSGILLSFNRNENWGSNEGIGLTKVPQPESSSARTGNHLLLKATWSPVESWA